MKTISLITRSAALWLIAAASLLCLRCNGPQPEGPSAGADTVAVAVEAPDATNNPILFANIGDRRIAYRTVGSGTPIILCSRFRGNLESWDPAFLENLAEKGYQVVTFDYRGLASSTGTPPQSIEEFAADVSDLAQALGFKKIIVGGWSLGGWVAQVVTAEYPDLVTHTILIGTKPPGNVKHPVEDIFLKTAWKRDYTADDEVILFFEPTSAVSRDSARASLARIARRTAHIDKFIDEPQWQAYVRASKDFETDAVGVREKLKTVKTPILVISADHEICFPPENWFELNRQLPTTQVLVIPQTGHGPHHQYPAFVAGSIDNFLRQF